MTGWFITSNPRLRGTASPMLIHGADWLPTLVERVLGGSLAGKTLPLDGVNMWSAIITRAATGPRHEWIYGHEHGPNNCGLCNGSWKLLREGGDKPSGFDPPGFGLVVPPPQPLT